MSQNNISKIIIRLRKLLRWHPYYSSLLILAVGIAVPLRVLMVMVSYSNSLPVTETAQRRDTVYVKLLNTGSLGVISQTTIAPQSSDDGFIRSSGASDTVLHSAPRLNDSTLTIVPQLLQPVIVSGEKPVVTTNKGWLLGIIAACLAALWIIRNVLVNIQASREEEKDPEELQHLMKGLSREIRDLGTPRKMIRFKNQVRFQYYILKEKNIVTFANQEVFIRLLLYIEGTDLIPKITVDGQNAFALFEKHLEENFFNRQASKDYDPDLVKELYVLNRGNLV